MDKNTRVAFAIKLGIEVSFTKTADRWSSRTVWLSKLDDSDALKKRMTGNAYLRDMLLKSVFMFKDCKILSVNQSEATVELDCPARCAAEVLDALESGPDTWMEAAGPPFVIAQYYDEPGTPDFEREPKKVRALKNRIAALVRPKLPSGATVASLDFTFGFTKTAKLKQAAKLFPELV